ncbi:hypothetical protein [Vibrio coralliilyticus]|uniref:hypothetical protein n=1 Tax=Vibrio coralliilyticus TaxID=190893 RepID=UPI002FD6C18D
MNKILQKQLARVVMTSNNGQSVVNAAKALDSLGDELDTEIFDEWVESPSKRSPANYEAKQADKQKELMELFKLPPDKQ